MTVNKYATKRLRLGVALRATKSHPFGKGAFSGATSPDAIEKKAAANLKKAREAGFSDSKIAEKAQAIANVEHNVIAKETAQKAREAAHEKGEYKMDAKRMRA